MFQIIINEVTSLCEIWYILYSKRIQSCGECCIIIKEKYERNINVSCVLALLPLSSFKTNSYRLVCVKAVLNSSNVTVALLEDTKHHDKRLPTV